MFTSHTHTHSVAHSCLFIVRLLFAVHLCRWVAARLQYCQAPYGARDYDSACSPYCRRQSHPAWNPYRSDCSGLISWSWGLPAPGHTTLMFAPFDNSITHVIPALDLQPGDAVNNREHVMMFVKWIVKGREAVFYGQSTSERGEKHGQAMKTGSTDTRL